MRRVSLMAKSESAAKRSKPKRRRGRSAVIVVLTVIFSVALGGGIWFFVQNASSYEFTGPAAQYYVDNVFRIPGDAVMRRSSNTTTIYYETTTRQPTNLPIYYEDRECVILPESLQYYNPRSNTIAKIDYYSEVQYDSHAMKAVRGGKSSALEGGFLFDGKDTYIFLEEMTILVDGHTFPISALSFAEAIYDNTLMIYDRATGEQQMLNTQTVAQAQAAGGDFTIALSTDTYEKYDGTRQLLFTDANLLTSVYEAKTS
jgi:hypothetical protein